MILPYPAQKLMTVYHGFHNHKAIYWDTHDLGETITLTVIDHENHANDAIEVLTLDAYEVRLMISELSRLLPDMVARTAKLEKEVGDGNDW